MPAQGGDAGPKHNESEEPDRDWDGGETDDNSTIWTEDFDREHYLDLMFAEGEESFRDFYLKQSGGRFSTTGDVSDWVTVPDNEARTATTPSRVMARARPTATGTTSRTPPRPGTRTRRTRAGATPRSATTSPTTTSGTGTTTTVTATSTSRTATSTTSRRSTPAKGRRPAQRAYSTDMGRTGPDGNKLGGVPLGDSGIWIGDYPTEPENGGLGVFTHEFAHDLGLPDLYDTAGGDNGTGFWSLMSGGSWLNPVTDDIGSRPGYMGAWGKLQMGWLDHEVVEPGEKATTRPEHHADPRGRPLRRGRRDRHGPAGHGHRGGLRLPLHRGLDRRRREVDRGRRPGRRRRPLVERGRVRPRRLRR